MTDANAIINCLMTCESHPGRLWSTVHTEAEGPTCPVPDCGGPGMPLIASLGLLEDLRGSLIYMADGTPERAYRIAQQIVYDEWDFDRD